MRLHRALSRAVVYGLVVAACVIVAFPVYWMVNTAVSPRTGLFVFPPALFPSQFSLTAFSEVVTRFPVLRWIWNTTVVSSATAIASVVLASLAAYSLSRFRFRGRWGSMMLILSTQMIPGTLLVIPIYLMFSQNPILLNSRFGLVIAYTTFSLPFCIWMLKGFFDTIPTELDDAALIDGCTRVQALFTVILPLAAPGIAATGLFAFIMGWDEFLLARVLLSTRDQWVVSVGISSFHGQYGVFFDQIAAASVLISVPVLVLFFLLQRHIVAGLTQGSVKG